VRGSRRLKFLRQSVGVELRRRGLDDIGASLEHEGRDIIKYFMMPLCLIALLIVVTRNLQIVKALQSTQP
jgi:hypothetical protein